MKAQVAPVREMLSFVMGLVLVTSITTLFVTLVYPRTTVYANQENMLNLIAHVDNILLQVSSSLDEFDSGTIDFTAEMPKKIQDNLYSVKIENSSSICIKILESNIKAVCEKYNVRKAVITGSYVSGSNLLVKANKTESGIKIEITNV